MNYFMPEREMDAYWYDAVYATEPALHYKEHYSKSPFKEMWEVSCSPIPKDAKILDIGCGPGQMGHMLHDMGYRNYIGFDFSSYVIGLAKQLPTNFQYETGDALTTELLNGDYDTVVSCEFVEHLNEDLKVLERIKSGTNCHISTSNSLSENHVRWFDNEKQVRDRYEYLFDNFKVECYKYPVNPLWWSWILRGTKK